jgi:hypothetical protein
LAQHLTDGDETPASPADNLTPSHNHRESVDSMSGARHRSNSYLSAHGAHSASPPTRDMIPDPRFQPAPPPRPSLMPARDSQEFGGNYIPATSSRVGFPSGSDGFPHGANQYQYGSSPRNIGIGTTPRGVSPGMGAFDDGVSGGRDYNNSQNYRASYGYPQQRQEFYNAGGNALPDAGREGPGRRHGSGGWNSGAGGQGYGGQFANQGRGQNMETDLSLD